MSNFIYFQVIGTGKKKLRVLLKRPHGTVETLPPSMWK